MIQDGTVKLQRYIGGGVVLVVLVWGFLLMGSPSFARKLVADRVRIGDLKEWKRGVVNYFEQKRKLPESLLEIDEENFSRRRFEDPTSKTPYEYRVVDQFTFELCATFQLSSEDAERDKWPNGPSGTSDAAKEWRYKPGHHCFRFEVPRSDS